MPRQKCASSSSSESDPFDFDLSPSPFPKQFKPFPKQFKQTFILKPPMKMNTGIVDEFEVPECKALADFGRLFEEGLFTDCSLVAEDGTEFKAHKNILACRSAVFRAMFEHEMVEAKEGIANIKDIKSPVLEQLLWFIYTGKAPKLGEMPVELFQAADIYGLDRLKILCEKELAKSVGNDNVCGLLVLANQYGVEKLKQCADNYIEKHIKEVIKSDGWKMMIEGNHEALVGQIVKTFAKAK